MKTISLIAFAVFIAFAANLAWSATTDSMQDQIIAKEREELDALKTGNIAAFANLLTDEAVFLNPHGPSPKAEVVKHVADFKLLDYSIEDVRYLAVGPKTGLIVYKLTQKAAANGHEFTSKAYISALWTERDGKWVCLFSQETPTK
jgi:ketosteroid isomerase-like protein